MIEKKEFFKNNGYVLENFKDDVDCVDELTKYADIEMMLPDVEPVWKFTGKESSTFGPYRDLCLFYSKEVFDVLMNRHGEEIINKIHPPEGPKPGCMYPNIKNLNVKIQYKFQKLLGIKLKLSEIKLRAYFMGSGIGLHKDKSPWDYSCSLNVYTKYFGSFMRQIPSSLNFIDYNGKKIKLQQNIGDAILYDGLKLEHWREPMNTNNRKDVQFQLLFAYTTDTKDTTIKRIKPKIYNRTRND